MTVEDLRALAPLIVLAITIAATLLAVTIRRGHGIAAVIAGTGLLAAFVSLLFGATSPRIVTPLIVVDGHASYYMGLSIIAALVIAFLGYRYMQGREEQPEEFYLLLLMATLGGAVLVCSRHFVSFFVALETMSVSLYGLIGYTHGARRSVEAGVKYLVLAGASSAFLLFGMALIYAETGALEFPALAQAFASQRSGGPLVLAGLGLMVVGVGFKLALAPFHLWTPDVYQGAPAPVTAYVATVSKGAVFAVLLRLFSGFPMGAGSDIVWGITAIAALSMLAGNILALLQRNVKRLLAFSSIAHLGYIMVAFVAGNQLGFEAAAYYFAAYFATTLTAFAVITICSDETGEADDINMYTGLFWKRPGLAAAFTLSLLSLAGLPLTAGFFAKFYLLTSGIHGALWTLAIVLVVSSTIGLYYYLRVVIAMIRQPDPAVTPKAHAAKPVPELHAILAALSLVIVWLGVWPAPLQQLIQQLMASL